MMTGTELREIRQRLGLSQRQFALQLGLHWNTLARFERNELNISGPVETLARLRLELTEKETARKSKRSKRK